MSDQDNNISAPNWAVMPTRDDGYHHSGHFIPDLENDDYVVGFNELPEYDKPQDTLIRYVKGDRRFHTGRYKQHIDRAKLLRLRIWKKIPKEDTPPAVLGGMSAVSKNFAVSNVHALTAAPEELVKTLEKWNPIETIDLHPDGFRVGEFLKLNFLPEGFKPPDIPGLDNFPDFLDSVESIVCEDLVSTFNKTRRTLDDAIRGPIRILNKLERKYFEILRDIDDFESSLIDLIKSIEGPDLNINNLFDAYTNLAESCLFYNSLGQLDGVLQMFEDIKNLAAMTTPEFKDQLIDKLYADLKEKLLGVGNNSAGKILDDLIKDNIGSFSQLKSMYWDMLKGAGVLDLLDSLAWIEQCIRDSCAAYKGLKGAVENTADRYRAELGIPENPDEPFDPIGTRMHKIQNRFGERWETVREKSDRLTGHITDLDSSLSKIKDNPDFFNIVGVEEFFGLTLPT